MYMMVDYVTREMTMKKSCKYGEYGLFEQLLFMSVLLLVLHETFSVIWLCEDLLSGQHVSGAVQCT